MPKAYWIAQVTVSNPDQYKLYAEGALAAFKKYDAKILARGEIPVLHVFSHNESAIALYRRQGMEIRRRLHVTVLQKV